MLLWFSLLTEGGDLGLNIKELMLLRIHCWGDLVEFVTQNWPCGLTGEIQGKEGERHAQLGNRTYL